MAEPAAAVKRYRYEEAEATANMTRHGCGEHQGERERERTTHKDRVCEREGEHICRQGEVAVKRVHGCGGIGGQCRVDCIKTAQNVPWNRVMSNCSCRSRYSGMRSREEVKKEGEG